MKKNSLGFIRRFLSVIPAVVIFFAAAVLLPGSTAISAVILVCSGLIICEKMFSRIRSMKKMKKYTENNENDDGAQNNESLFKTLNPIAGIRIDGTVAWYNTPFFELFPNASSKRISELCPEISLSRIFEAETAQPQTVSVGNDTYLVHMIYKKKAAQDHAAIIIHMEKTTELTKLRAELEKMRFAVAELVIDNYDEAIEEASDAERLDITTFTEKCITSRIQDVGGIVKKIEKDKYTAVFTREQLNLFEESKFSILQEVKRASTSSGIVPTVSMGIGVGESSLFECDVSAKKALEMALGRGGDQVVVRENEKFRYFGGNSKETEKRTKVKARVMAHNLRELISGCDNVLIMGHKNSDTDAVGAAIGIAGMASFAGKNAKILLATKDDTVHLLLEKIEKNHYHDDLFIGKNAVREFVSPKTLLVVCDTHVPQYTEMPELLEMIKTKVVIDHHRRSESFIENADIVYHEPFASSACEMVAELMQYFDKRYAVSTIDAEALYAGIVMDTKNFMFKTGVRTFEAAAYLRAAGVDTLRVKRLFRESIENYKLKACIVTEAQVYRDNIAISLFSGIVPHVIISAAADELLEITDMKASFVVARGENGKVIVSGRSLGEINVQLIVEKLGGGGHMMLAGAQLDGAAVSDVGEKLKTAIDEILS